MERCAHSLPPALSRYFSQCAALLWRAYESYYISSSSVCYSYYSWAVMSAHHRLTSANHMIIALLWLLNHHNLPQKDSQPPAVPVCIHAHVVVSHGLGNSLIEGTEIKCCAGASSSANISVNISTEFSDGVHYHWLLEPFFHYISIHQRERHPSQVV